MHVEKKTQLFHQSFIASTPGRLVFFLYKINPIHVTIHTKTCYDQISTINMKIIKHERLVYKHNANNRTDITQMSLRVRKTTQKIKLVSQNNMHVLLQTHHNH